MTIPVTVAMSCSCSCGGNPVVAAERVRPGARSRVGFVGSGIGYGWRRDRARGVRASMVDSAENSSDFVKRMEQAWLISQQPRPIACSSCDARGHLECKWCRGTGFFILGDNMLCQVPSRSTTCVICAGKGSTSCSDCKGTGFRAKWLGEPPIPKEQQ